jgi:hypothetical protein
MELVLGEFASWLQDILAFLSLPSLALAKTGTKLAAIAVADIARDPSPLLALHQYLL